MEVEIANAEFRSGCWASARPQSRGTTLTGTHRPARRSHSTIASSPSNDGMSSGLNQIHGLDREPGRTKKDSV